VRQQGKMTPSPDNTHALNTTKARSSAQTYTSLPPH
jgi:hypothetical protein